jgi:hypothetical protein
MNIHFRKRILLSASFAAHVAVIRVVGPLTGRSANPGCRSDCRDATDGLTIGPLSYT